MTKGHFKESGVATLYILDVCVGVVTFCISGCWLHVHYNIVLFCFFGGVTYTTQQKTINEHEQV